MASADFKSHLSRQLAFLARSCEAFDLGHTDEAIRIATVIRILLHQTKSSTSLLKHLNKTTINLLSTTEAATDKTLMLMGMGTVRVGPGEEHQYYPSLDQTPIKRFVPVSMWWDMVVFVGGGHRLSRRKIVLSAANQDGGAHVDEKLSTEYKALTEAGFAGAVFHSSGGKHSEKPLLDAHFISLRQMGYELLNSPDLIQAAA